MLSFNRPAGSSLVVLRSSFFFVGGRLYACWCMGVEQTVVEVHVINNLKGVYGIVSKVSGKERYLERLLCECELEEAGECCVYAALSMS